LRRGQRGKIPGSISDERSSPIVELGNNQFTAFAGAAWAITAYDFDDHVFRADVQRPFLAFVCNGAQLSRTILVKDARPKYIRDQCAVMIRQNL
jgi:hypothetical protein